MKKLLTTLLIIFALFGSFGIESTFAQTTPDDTSSDAIDEGIFDYVDPSTITPETQAQRDARAAQEAQAQKDKTNNESSGFSWSYLMPWTWVNFGVKLILQMILSVLGFALTAAGGLLDVVISVTILNMKWWVTQLPSLNLITNTVRDFISMFFIYLLLNAAFRMILNVNGQKVGVPWKSILTRIVVVMIAINFSPFVTKVLIDVSNIVTVGFYRQLPGVNLTNSFDGVTGTVKDMFGWSNDSGLSSTLMGTLRLSSIYKIESGVETKKTLSQFGLQDLGKSYLASSTENMYLIIAAIMSSVVIVIVFFIFVAASAMLLYRFFVLLILIMTCPVMFIGYAAPEIAEIADYQKKWWTALKKQLIFAPAFMFLIWVALTIANDPAFITIVDVKNLSWGEFFRAPIAGGFRMVFNFIFVISFLMAALTLPKRFGDAKVGAIGDFASNTLTKIYEGAKSVAGNELIGRRLGDAADKFKERPFVKTTRIGQEINKSVQQIAGTKFGGESYADYKKANKGFEEARKVIDKRKGIEGILDVAKTSGSLTGVMEAELNNNLKKMSGKQLSELGKDDSGNYVALNPNVIKQLTDEQLDSLDKTFEKDDDKVKLREVRTSQITSNLGDESALQDALKNTSNKTIGLLDAATLKNEKLIKNLSEAQFKAAMDSGLPQSVKNDLEQLRKQHRFDTTTIAAMDEDKFEKEVTKSNLSQATKDALKSEREAARFKSLKDAIAAGVDATIKAEMGKFSYKEVGKLGPDVLANDKAMKYLSPRILAVAADNNKLNDADRQKIRDFIEDEVTKPGGTPTKENTDAAGWLTSSPAGTVF